MKKLLFTGGIASVLFILPALDNGQTARACPGASHMAETPARSWLAGDHHVHSIYSAEWDKSVSPPKAILGGDANYSILKNVQMAHRYGLDWLVITDHGGPNHSKLNIEKAYPDLQKSRLAVPGVLQFYGMELDTPGAKHSSLIMPHSPFEARNLYKLEKAYDVKDAYPKDKTRDTEARMLDALESMKRLPCQPVIIANHPGRGATGSGAYTKVTPRELRNWNDRAPTVAIGMEGAPGHQAVALSDARGTRGDYDRFHTMGGFDQMTARLGGFWDSMLGEGRHWWIVAGSDSHHHYTEGGKDFWPGEYSKTYIYAEKNYDDILGNMRAGRIFVTTGDLINELYVSVEIIGQPRKASVGETLEISKGDSLRITVKFSDPETPNAGGRNPRVKRVDLITGLITGKVKDKNTDTNPTTVIIGRYKDNDWQNHDGYKSFSYILKNVTKDRYIRVRGTNTSELEPEIDPEGENPWNDLWFYSNPVFIKIH